MKSRTLFVCILIIPYFLSFSIKAQEVNQQLISSHWETGIIELRDGKQLRGKLSFNFITDVVQLDDGTRTQGFTPIHVAHFALINDSSAKQTHYYSFPFTGKKSKMKPFSFYELVHQNGVVALLSRHEYIYKEKNIGIIDPMGMSFGQDQVATEKVREILYLTSAQAEILKYGFVIKDKNSFVKPGYNSPTIYRDPRGPSLEGITDRVPDQKYNTSKKVLQEIMTDKYDPAMEYADTEKLKPNTIEELKKILDYYAGLMKQH